MWRSPQSWTCWYLVNNEHTLQGQRSKKQQHCITPVTKLQTLDGRFQHIHTDVVGPLPESCGTRFQWQWWFHTLHQRLLPRNWWILARNSNRCCPVRSSYIIDRQLVTAHDPLAKQIKLPHNTTKTSLIAQPGLLSSTLNFVNPRHYHG